MSETGLKRQLGLLVVSFYGLGTIIGAGIYVLVGKVAGAAGLYLPLSFLVAGVIATFTAFSYAELSARFPQSAGSALYVFKASRKVWPAQALGLLVVLTGVISAATIARGFVGYLQLFVAVPGPLAVVLLLVLLSAIACWGITESAWTVSVVTLIELFGLLYVVTIGLQAPQVNALPDLMHWPDSGQWLGIGLGAAIAFYAFIGFEDMVNIAEEVRNPQRTMPLAITLALFAATGLYALIAWVALRSSTPAVLADSAAPLASIVARAGHDPGFIGLISLFAVVNGALVQLIMASRLLYGLAKKGMLPAALARLHPQRRTPILATLLVAVVMVVFALTMPLTALARLTSAVMLVVFCVVNVSLIVIRRRDGLPPAGAISLPLALPWAGLLSSLGLLIFQAVSL